VADWKNDDLVLYHACTDESLRPQNPGGIAVNSPTHYIKLAEGGKRREFGRGFYATTVLRQAKSWANARADRAASQPTTRGSANAVVLRFAVARDKLAALEALVFTTEHAGFFPFVEYCRSGKITHGRSGNPTIYDVIYGPVTTGRLPRLIIKDCDQVSFHTAKALAAIPSVTIEARGNPLIRDVW
jgi:hypothetical protein